MPKYLLAFHGGGDPPETEEESAKLLAAWGEWMEGLGDVLLDPGSPTVMTKTVSNAGVEDGGGVNPVSGYSLVKALDIDAAAATVAGCPIFDAGGSIEIAEMEEM